MKIDHFAVSGTNLEEATEYVESTLGFKMQKGGKHEIFGTHNNLLGLKDGLYLECISIDPDCNKIDNPRWFNLDNFYGPPRLTNWICSCEKIEKIVMNTSIDVGKVKKIKRDKLNWKMTVKNDGILPFNNIFPAFIEWNKKSSHPSKNLVLVECELYHLTIYHPQVLDFKSNLKRLKDYRISYENNKKTGIVAEFKTKSGNKILSSFSSL